MEKAARAVLAVVAPSTASRLGSLSGDLLCWSILALRELRVFLPRFRNGDWARQKVVTASKQFINASVPL